MSKKHLEEIIDKWVYALESGRDGSYLSVEDVEYLIEQAERVEELEERVKEYEINIIENGVDIFKMTNEINALEVQNKRYREALEFYADEETYEEIKYEAVYQGGVPIEPPSGEPPLIYYDKGKAARKALEGESNE